MMRRVAVYGTLAVALVTAANLLHGLSHAKHEVPLTAWQELYVANLATNPVTHSGS